MPQNFADYTSKQVHDMAWWQQIITWTSAGKNFDAMWRHQGLFTNMFQLKSQYG